MRGDIPPCRPSDTDPQPEELVGSEMLSDGLQPVVSLQSSPLLQPDRAERQFQIIMDDEDFFWFDAKEPGGLCDGHPAFIHERLRLQQSERPAGPVHLRPDAMEFFLPRFVCVQRRADHPSCIVSCTFILLPGVAEKYKKFYHNANQYTMIPITRQWRRRKMCFADPVQRGCVPCMCWYVMCRIPTRKP